MMRKFRLALILAAPLALSACFGSVKVPTSLSTISSSAPVPAAMTRASAPGEAVTIDVPVIPKELATTRVPAQVGPTAVAYIKDMMWVETPDRLFQNLLQETTMRTTSRVVLDPRQSSLDPGTKLTGTLSRFGYDTGEHVVIVRYDGALATANGAKVETRRFEAKVAADGTAATVGPALNEAANQVASEVAQWIGGQ